MAGGFALAALALAGCAERRSEPPPPPLSAAEAPGPAQRAPDIDWHARLADDAVRVVLVDPSAQYRVERVVLDGPAGQRIAAREITHESGPGEAGPSYGIGGGFGSHSGGGIGLGMTVPLGARPAGPARRTLAVIPLPDPAAYRHTARDWTIRVTLRDRGGTAFHASIPAPLP